MIQEYFSNIESIVLLVQVVAAVVTAFSTLALFYVTWVLAAETRNLSKASSAPFVIVTLEPSPWSLFHLEVVVQNTGNAAAFDVIIKIDLQNKKNDENPEYDLPFENISALRPGQTLKSFVGEFREFKELNLSFEVSWVVMPNSARRDIIKYDFNLSHLRKMSRLGAASPAHQIADEIKGLRKDWQGVAQGRSRIKSDIFSGDDRAQESAELQEQLKAYKAAREATNDINKQTE